MIGPLKRFLFRFPLSIAVWVVNLTAFATLNRGGALPQHVLEQFGFNASLPLAVWPWRSFISDFLYFSEGHFFHYGLFLPLLMGWAEWQWGCRRTLALVLGLSIFDDIVNYGVWIYPQRMSHPEIFRALSDRYDVGGSYVFMGLLGYQLVRVGSFRRRRLLAAIVAVLYGFLLLERSIWKSADLTRMVESTSHLVIFGSGALLALGIEFVSLHFHGKKLPFVKMHGLGNDFVVIDGMSFFSPSMTAALATRLCDRRLGIGADQLLHLRRPHSQDSSALRPDARMEIWNADGSTAEMCGNGIRAVALYLNKKYLNRREFSIETLAGLKTVFLEGDGRVRVNMGVPQLSHGVIADFAPSGYPSEYYEVNVGNPHAVFFVEDVSLVELERVGPLVEKHERFPNRTNAEWVQFEGTSAIRVRVWERGAGATLACGTGACASAVAALASGRAKSPLSVRLPGGELTIDWKGPGEPVWMIGPAAEVFRGEVACP